MILKYLANSGAWVYIDNIREVRSENKCMAMTNAQMMDYINGCGMVITTESAVPGDGPELEHSNNHVYNYKVIHVFPKAAQGLEAFTLLTENVAYLLNDNGKTIETFY